MRLRSQALLLSTALVATLTVQPSVAVVGTTAPSAAGTYDNGGEGNAEIVAHDPASQRLFVVDAADAQLTILDATDLSFVADVDLPGDPNSVDVRPGSAPGATDALVAVALADGTNPGSVLFVDVDGTTIAQVTVGDLAAGDDSSLPDMVTFTPDGTKLLVANEGEYDPGDPGVASDDTDPEGSVSVIDVDPADDPIDGTDVVNLDFRGFNADVTLTEANGFHPDPLAASIAHDVEPEYITTDDDVAWVSLQEFNAVARVELAPPAITHLLPLGFVDHSTVPLDGLDDDGEINLLTWDNLFGVRMPDTIDSWVDGTTTYLVTANEGDARAQDVEGTPFDSDSVEAKIEDLTLDPTAFPDAAAIQSDETGIGELLVTPNLGDDGADNDYDRLYAFGGRSFTIFSYDTGTPGVLTEVFDSGDSPDTHIEQYIATNFPFAFNADDPIEVDDSDPANPVPQSDLDNRSDNKGPEPEGLAIGTVAGTRYAFVGLERQGGILVYSIQDPTEPTLAAYLNGRNLTDYERGVLDWDGSGTVNAADGLDYETNGGDVSPEGITFVTAADSPTGRELLVVAHEVSGTVTTYDVGLDLDVPPALPAATATRELDVAVERTAGPRREDTAVEVSKLVYPDGADVVFVATALNYADALTGGPLAAAMGGPILLTVRDNFDPNTEREIRRLDPDEIVVLGGPVAISESTYDDIEDLGIPTRRIAGDNRFATAALINDELTGGDAERVFVVEGVNASEFRGWPDAVSVSAYAAFTGTPIVPVAADTIPSDTADSLADLGPTEFVVIGGEVAVSAAVADGLTDDENHTVRRLAGENRFATSAAVYDEALTRGLGTTEKWLATGRKFPDALTGGAGAGTLGHSLLLVESENDGLASFPETVARLSSAIDTTDIVRLLGGTTAIPAADADDVENIVTPDPAPAAELCLTILHNNDGESQLVDGGRGLEDFGGAARFASVVARERARALEPADNCTDQGVIQVTSGDNFLAGPEFAAARDAGVPLLDGQLYDYLDYDAIALGNHDFDFGTSVTNDFLRSFTADDDAVFLSANLDTGVTGPMAVHVNLDRLQPSTTVDVAGHTVGIIGLTTPTLRSISSPEGTRILGLDADGNEDLDALAAVVADERDALQSQGADVIVLISHLQGIDSDQALLAKLSGIDVVVAGGGDEILAAPGSLLTPGDETEIFGDYPLLAPDADGNQVPTVTTAGSYRYLGRAGVRFDADGDLVAVDPDSRMVRVATDTVFDGVSEDAWVRANIVDPVVAFNAGLAADVVATSNVDLDGVRARVRTQETNIGALLADGMANAAATRAASFGLDNGDPFVGLANGGGIRNDSVIPAGDVTRLDTFDIAPFTNFVAVFTGVTPADLDTILEHAYSEVENVDGRFAQLGGLRVEVDLDADAGERVSNITLQDGSPITTVNLAMPDFTARGGDDYPTDTLGDFTIVGVSYQEALAEYLEQLGTVDAADYPDLTTSTDGALRIIYS